MTYHFEVLIYRRWTRRCCAWSVVVLATGSVAACGGRQDRKTVGADQRTHAPVAMVVTPPAALARCRRAWLLRPICPRRVPASRPGRYILADGCGNQAGITIASRRCTLPAWSYQIVTPITGSAPTSRITAWDGQRWVIPTYAALTPPPYQVHVLIQAEPVTMSVAKSPTERPRRLSDVLLASARRRVADLGPVRWFGQSGRLLLEPTGASGGGEEAGHIVFAFRRRQIDYEITLHAWASRERITTGDRRLEITDGQPGDALPHAVATLKAVVGSAIGHR